MSKKVLIIGATGSLGRTLRTYLLEHTDYPLTLFSRSAQRINDLNTAREQIVTGDVLETEELTKLIEGHDAVFAALTGNLGDMARSIVTAMEQTDTSRLIFISSMGIYNEIPAYIGSSNLSENSMLKTYREAADIVEASNLNYTVIRPGWFDHGSDDYEVTVKGEPFGGHDVSRNSIVDLVYRLIADDTLYSRNSIGIHRP